MNIFDKVFDAAMNAVDGVKELVFDDKPEVKLTADEQFKSNAIIHTAATAAAGIGAGLAQLPLADAALIAPIQITMVTSLGPVFGIAVDDSMAKGIIASLAASYVGRGAVQLLVGWIPVAGNAINAATAAAITEALGWAAVSHFKSKQKDGYPAGVNIGINKASKEYEEKLRKQAQDFLVKVKIQENAREEFLKLIAEYMKLINQYEMERNNEKTSVLKKELSTLTSLPFSK